MSVANAEPPQESSKPKALLALEASRKAIISGEIEWNVKANNEPLMNVKSMYARNGDWLFENKGDGDGRVAGGKGPVRLMRNASGYWFVSNPMAASLTEPDNPERPPLLEFVKDIRFIGIAPSPWSMNEGVGFTAVWDDPHNKIVFWQETRDGDRFTVRGEADSGAVFEWTVNSAKGWCVERVAFGTQDQWTQEARSDLKKFGDVWMPARTEYFLNGENTATVTIERALVNQDSDAASLTPSDAGLEPGTHVTIAGKPATGPDLNIWNGDEICKFTEWAQDVKAGRRAYGPTFQKFFAENKPGAAQGAPRPNNGAAQVDGRVVAARREARRHAGLWEAYVLKFIERYKLGDEQSQKAMQILAQCQQRADQILSLREPQLIALYSEQAATTDTERNATLQEKIDKLRAPIDEVFEQQLKPRLNKIPTHSQRDAAGG